MHLASHSGRSRALCDDGEWPLPESGSGWRVPAFSQLLEDQFAMIALFAGMTGGYFLEIGALNGLQLSNTKLLEMTFGWSGVLIEAHRGTYKALEANRGALSATTNQAVCKAVEGRPLRYSASNHPATGRLDPFTRPDLAPLPAFFIGYKSRCLL